MPARAAPAPTPIAPPARANGQWLQLASMRKEEEAQAFWDKLKQQNVDILGHSEPVIQHADLGATKGVYFRLRVGPFPSAQSANGLCSALKERQIDCVIMHNEKPPEKQASASLPPGVDVP